MNLRKKLHIFETMARREAEERSEAERLVVAEKYDEAYASILKDADASANKRMEAELGREESEKNKRVLHASMESKKDLYQLKEKLSGEVYKRVYARLGGFAGSQEYPGYIIKKANELKNGAPDGGASVSEIVLRTADMHIAEEVSRGCGLKVSESPEDFCGGFLLKIKDKNAVIDMSFKTKFEELKENHQIFGAS